MWQKLRVKVWLATEREFNMDWIVDEINELLMKSSVSMILR